MGLLSVSVVTNIIEGPFIVLLSFYTQVLGLNLFSCDRQSYSYIFAIKMEIEKVSEVKNDSKIWKRKEILPGNRNRGVQGCSQTQREAQCDTVRYGAEGVERAGRLKYIKAQWCLQMMTERKDREIQREPGRLQALAESAGVKAWCMSAYRRVR